VPRGKLLTAGQPVADWKIDRILAEFAGIEPLIEAHRAFGFSPLNYSQVAHWKDRHTIPSERLAELFVVLKSMRDEVDLWEYITVRR